MDNNKLKYQEKPYYTKEERLMYTKIALDEAIKQENYELANYYKILLEMYESIEDDMSNSFINSMKKK